jgi:competence protein ComEC
MLGIAYGREISPGVPASYLWLTSLTLFALTALFYVRRHPGWPSMLLLLTAALGALVYAQSRLPVERLYPFLSQMSAVRGLVVSYPAERPDRTSFLFQPEGLPGFLQIFYRHPYGSYREIAYGDVLELTARFKIPWQFEDFDYREYLRTRNVWGVSTLWSARGIRNLGAQQGHPLLRWGDRARRELFARIDRVVPEPGNALLKGLMFGERAYLGRDIEESFRNAGVMHVLAVSGLHLGILLGLFWWIFRRAGLSITLTYGLLLPLVLLYLTLVGFKVSLVRAALMFAFVALGWVLTERGMILRSWIDPLQGLSAAAFVILALSPSALFDVSFQLSFAATAGILIALQFMHPRWQTWSAHLKERRRVGDSLLGRMGFWVGERLVYLLVISTAAQLAVAPLLAFHFQRVYGGTLLANLIIVPLVMIALWLGVVVLLAAMILPEPVAGLVGALEGAWLAGLSGVVGFFSQLPWAYWIVDRGVQTTLWVLLPLALDPGAGHFVWAISRTSRTKFSVSWMKRSMARLATLRGRSARRL